MISIPLHQSGVDEKRVRALSYDSGVGSPLARTHERRAGKPSTPGQHRGFSADTAVWWNYNDQWVEAKIESVLGDGYYDIGIVCNTTKTELGRDKVFGIEGCRLRLRKEWGGATGKGDMKLTAARATTQNLESFSTEKERATQSSIAAKYAKNSRKRRVVKNPTDSVKKSTARASQVKPSGGISRRRNQGSRYVPKRKSPKTLEPAKTIRPQADVKSRSSSAHVASRRLIEPILSISTESSPSAYSPGPLEPTPSLTRTVSAPWSYLGTSYDTTESALTSASSATMPSFMSRSFNPLLDPEPYLTPL
eukprot:820302-Amorphochlora_amoeboformis.AAC.1